MLARCFTRRFSISSAIKNRGMADERSIKREIVARLLTRNMDEFNRTAFIIASSIDWKRMKKENAWTSSIEEIAEECKTIPEVVRHIHDVLYNTKKYEGILNLIDRYIDIEAVIDTISRMESAEPSSVHQNIINVRRSINNYRGCVNGLILKLFLREHLPVTVEHIDVIHKLFDDTVESLKILDRELDKAENLAGIRLNKQALTIAQKAVYEFHQRQNSEK